MVNSFMFTLIKDEKEPTNKIKTPIIYRNYQMKVGIKSLYLKTISANNY